MVRIEHKVTTQDSNGDIVTGWQTFADKVPAAIEPLSARDLIAAQAVQSEVVARITMRYRPGLLASMRIVHGSTIYNIAGVLPDPVSGVEYITVPVSAGVNEG